MQLSSTLPALRPASTEGAPAVRSTPAIAAPTADTVSISERAAALREALTDGVEPGSSEQLGERVRQRLANRQEARRDQDVVAPAEHDHRSENAVEVAEEHAKPSDDLSDEDKEVVVALRNRDAEVRAHEAAHAGIGGGSPSYSFQRGPDGRQYAVGGEVQIDTSGGSTPQETIAKMNRVRAAALAPASPSGQDRAVAASAARRAAAAQAEQFQQTREDAELAAEERAEASGVEAPKEGVEPQAPRGVEAPSEGRQVEEPAVQSEDAVEAAAAEVDPGDPATHGHGPGANCPFCAPKVDRFVAQAAQSREAPRAAVAA